MSAEWKETVAATMHFVPESEDSEGAYEAVTISGVPHDVTVTGEDRDSKEEALAHLCRGLQTFGFRGRVLVRDVTSLGYSEEYEMEVA